MYRNIAATVCIALVGAVSYEYFIAPPPANPDTAKLEVLSKGMPSLVQKNTEASTEPSTQEETAP